MAFQDFMAKVRHLDNLCARWMVRHFFIIFFEFVLVIIFFTFFYDTIRSFFLPYPPSSNTTSEYLLAQVVFNIRLIVVLLLLNSFWMLYIFNGMNRLRTLLKEISFNLSKRRSRNADLSD
ncbi:MAG TPA: hypothetical protein PLT76_06890 [Candidatus Omnitrophota bacterium]|nr:hypothetical protein [Candidatus Omnitrophota bacterium]HQO58432.1 hypothetical protein [Candidatus Omnitrophota bacterium]HQP12018.1 hypothetical protein [Candidatus Omnitrophota bacterium]